MNPNKYDHPDLKGGEEGPPVPSLEPRNQPPTSRSVQAWLWRGPFPGVGGRQTLLGPEGNCLQGFSVRTGSCLALACALLTCSPLPCRVSSSRGLGAAGHPPAWGRQRWGGGPWPARVLAPQRSAGFGCHPVSLAPFCRHN